MPEQWVNVEGQVGYAVSDLGRMRGPKGVVLKPLMGARYPRVDLTRGRREYVHRLVAAAFIGSADGRQVNHIDGDKTNSKATNLEYCTCSENMKHAFRIGLQSNVGERHSRAKLSDEKVFELRSLLARGQKQSEVAKMMNVSQSAVSRVKTGARWSHLSAQAVGA